MKIRVLIAAALLSFGCLAHADEASHSKAVEDLLADLDQAIRASQA